MNDPDFDRQITDLGKLHCKCNQLQLQITFPKNVINYITITFSQNGQLQFTLEM